MKKQELIDFLSWFQLSGHSMYVNTEYAVDSFLSINSKALDKIPNVIDNEMSKESCANYMTCGDRQKICLVVCTYHCYKPQDD